MNKLNYEIIRDKFEKYPQPLSLIWRINHTIPYLIGGTTFLYGSIQYLPEISNYDLGGWLFTIGSTGKLYYTSFSFFLSFFLSFFPSFLNLLI